MEARPVVVLTTYPGRYTAALGRTITWWTWIGPEELLFSMDRKDELLRNILKVGSFTVNYLGPEQTAAVAALEETANIEGVGLHWKRGKDAPYIAEAWRRVECKIAAAQERGSTRLVVGRVVSDRTTGTPIYLLRCGPRYHRMGAAVKTPT